MSVLQKNHMQILHFHSTTQDSQRCPQSSHAWEQWSLCSKIIDITRLLEDFMEIDSSKLRKKRLQSRLAMRNGFIRVWNPNTSILLFSFLKEEFKSCHAEKVVTIFEFDNSLFYLPLLFDGRKVHWSKRFRMDFSRFLFVFLVLLLLWGSMMGSDDLSQPPFCSHRTITVKVIPENLRTFP